MIGLPDEDYGNAVHAIVQAARAADRRRAGGSSWARGVAKYKRPRTYEFVAAPLRGDDGKVRRSALRAERVAARQSPSPGGEGRVRGRAG